MYKRVSCVTVCAGLQKQNRNINPQGVLTLPLGALLPGPVSRMWSGALAILRRVVSSSSSTCVVVARRAEALHYHERAWNGAGVHDVGGWKPCDFVCQLSIGIRERNQRCNLPCDWTRHGRVAGIRT